jgi:ubiquinone biosynthesis protein COQ4
MKKIIRVLKGVWSAIRLLRDPNRLDEVFKLVDAVVEPKHIQIFVDQISQDPEMKKRLSEKVRLGPIHLEALKALPAETFGNSFYRFIVENKLDPAAMPRLPDATDTAYVTAYYHETHDLFHVALGFDTSLPGELGVQAFYSAQSRSRHSILLLGLSFFNIIFKNYNIAEVDARFREIVRGWMLGKSSKLLFGVRWNELWARPLDEVRRELGIDLAYVNANMPKQPNGPLLNVAV